jgi:high-affinity Fe2+/Pb2+ permease
MVGGENMFLGIAAAVFGAFFLNVLLGASGIGTYLNDVSEMLFLLVAVLFFVAAILKKEAAANKPKTNENETKEDAK